MKYILSVLLLCIGINMVQGQEVYMSSGKNNRNKKAHKQQGFDPSRLILGGGLNAAFGGGYTGVGISPLVGYRITDHLSAGVGMGYQYYKQPQLGIVDYNNPDRAFSMQENVIYPSVWARCFLFRNLFFDATFEYNFIKIKGYGYDGNGDVVPATFNANVPCALAGLGIRQPLGGRVSALFEVMYDVLQQEYSPYYGQPVFRLGFVVGL